MELLIFDMDGVLLKPLGYHLALKETVRLAGLSSGVGELFLTDAQISQFEALGISSEWHSSALCMAVMVLQKNGEAIRDTNPAKLFNRTLDDLFVEIERLPMKQPALKRGLAATEILATKFDHSEDSVRALVENSVSIEESQTMNWFQELILGSVEYKKTYKKEPQFHQESFLKIFDQRLINESAAEKINHLALKDGYGAAIMTNRPSNGLPGFDGAPDAKMGAALVGLETIPLIGNNEMSWLAKETSKDIGEMLKPSWVHALAAILVASGWSLCNSLDFVRQDRNALHLNNLFHLQDSSITVFEDTPGGLVAVQEAGNLLIENGLRVKIQKIGIGEDVNKKEALSSQGAMVYSNINQALNSLDNFRIFFS
ncbi:hypothetical protein ACFLXB_02885 [Chloroflexota bacterium]